MSENRKYSFIKDFFKGKEWSLRTILTSAIVLIAGIATIAVGYISYGKSYNYLFNSTQDKLKIQTQVVRDNVDLFLTNTENQVNVLSSNGNVTGILSNPDDATWLMNLLASVQSNVKDFSSVYMGTKDKKFYMQPQEAMPDGYDPTSRPWYQEAIKEPGKVVWTEPYKDASTGQMVVTAAKAIIVNGNIIGVIGADVNLNYLTDKISKVKVGKTGYTYIASGKGIAIANPDSKLIGQDESKIPEMQKVFSDNGGFYSYKDNNTNSTLYQAFETSSVNQWKIGTVIPEEELLDQVNQLRTDSIIITIIILLIAILISVFIASLITKALKNMISSVEGVSHGDFSNHTENISIKELNQLGQAYNEMLETIKSLKEELDTLIVAAGEGNLAERGNTARFNGGWGELVLGINKLMEEVNAPVSELMQVLRRVALNDYTQNMVNEYKGIWEELKVATNDVMKRLIRVVDINERIANGDLSDLEELKKVGRRSENDRLMPGFVNKLEAIKALIEDTEMLSDAAIIGKLDVRADVTRHRGEYAKIVDGVNKTLDAIVHPLEEARGILGKMSLNDYTVEMSSQYQGMFKDFADSINAMRNRLLSLLDSIERVAVGDTSRLEETRKVGKRCENDRVMPAMNGMMEAIQGLVDEMDMLTREAVAGNLSIRGESEKFNGGYKKIVEGVNSTLDAMLEPVKESSAVLQQMSKGNLDVAVKGDYKGDHAIIKNALNDTIGTFNEILGEFNTAADQVAAGSRHVSDSSQSLSQGSSEQASSVEQITASIEEISAQTKQNAVNANQANELALVAKVNAEDGNEQMKGMLKAMEEINEASGNISKIIKVIDEIAFQTNMLALNAAVEAARAGQHGKGFAVVAEEVRNLAARSANAVKETTEMIEGSIRKVEAGTEIANHTAEALNKIVDGVAKAATIVGDIAIASNEQATGITQVNQGIMQVSQVTQTNTATAQQSASASEELSSQAQMLKEMVRRFKLKNNNTGSGFKSAVRPSNYGETQADEGAEAYAEASPMRRVKISLDDKEFGKY